MCAVQAVEKNEKKIQVLEEMDAEEASQGQDPNDSIHPLPDLTDNQRQEYAQHLSEWGFDHTPYETDMEPIVVPASDRRPEQDEPPHSP